MMYPGTCHVNCQGLQPQDLVLNIEMEKQEEPDLCGPLEETCSCNQCSLPTIKEDSFLWNMEKQERFWKFKKLEELPATFPELGRESLSESMIKKENVCALDDDDGGNVRSPDLVKSQQKVNSSNWETVFKNETVIKKESDCVGRNSKTSLRLSEDFVNYPCNRNIIPTDVCEVKNSMSVLVIYPATDTDKPSCADKKIDDVADKIRNLDRISSTNMKQYKCLDCGARFSSKASIEVHIIKHVREEMSTCQSVRVEGNQKKTLSYSCDICDHVCSSHRSLQRHKKLHTGEKPYKCDFCGHAFSDSRNLKSHRRLHTGEKPYKCDDCNVEFSWYCTFRLHKLKHTGEKPYKCGYCNGEFYRKDSLLRHERKHTGEKPYKCDFCGHAFSDSSDLKSHKRLHTVEKPYKCDYCNSEFRYKQNLNVHKRKHTGEKPYKCGFCSKAFSQSFYLKRHERVHTGEKPHKCDECDAKFIHKCDLHAHQRKHAGEKPYKCDDCNAEFYKKGGLLRHERKHTGEKPYKCDFCYQAFSDSSNLKSHRRLHTGEKPYKCDFCGQSFIKSRQLKSHKIFHTEEKQYKSDECNVEFNHKSVDIIYKYI